MDFNLYSCITKIVFIEYEFKSFLLNIKNCLFNNKYIN